MQAQQRNFCEVNIHDLPQDVFLMIRRHKTTIFTDAKESTTVYELKRIVEGILKRPPENQKLYKVIKTGAAQQVVHFNSNKIPYLLG